MKNTVLKNLFIMLLSIALFHCNGGNKKRNQAENDSLKVDRRVKSDSDDRGISLKNIKPNNKDDSISKQHSGLDTTNVVKSSTIQPYREVDSLETLINKQFKFAYLSKLDSICSKSDGDLSEQLDVVNARLFINNTDHFIDFLLKHANSCLQKSLILGISSNYSVYDKKERHGKLIKDRDNLIRKVKMQGLSDSKIKFIKTIFDKVDPNILD